MMKEKKMGEKKEGERLWAWIKKKDNKERAERRERRGEKEL